jgi:6-pyruvoyltetrahydropterin/6-carboxytetrahydropterin synthase
MNEKMKCFQIHGHTYLFELTFEFESISTIGYAIDFKEIKRVACQWIDDLLDHGVICNPHDDIMIKAAKDLKSKTWVMSLNGIGQYCNPTVENIVKEIFLAMRVLFENNYVESGLKIHHVKLYETPNCWTDCYYESINESEEKNFNIMRRPLVLRYAEEKGIVDYSDSSSQ